MMKRRAFIAAAGASLGAARSGHLSTAGDTEAIQQLIKDCYSIYYTDRDRSRYRALLTDDYLLLEKGEIMDADADSALMPAPGSDYRRTDSFDFRRLKVQGDVGYIVYIVKSDIMNKKKTPQNVTGRWLESAIVRRSGQRWRIALLHSTQIMKRAP
jgi:ketosteroid isomerase-like protein